MNAQADGTNQRHTRPHRNGLAWFVAAMTFLVLLVAVGANLMFSTMHGTHAPRSASEKSAAGQSPAFSASTRGQPDPVPAVHGATADPASGSSTTAHSADPAGATQATVAKPTAVSRAAFAPPSEDKFPDGKFGAVARLGEQIFLETGKHASRFVGNDLNCANCHLDAGRKADSAPMWAAFTRYPAYRGKTGTVDTLAARIQGCFTYSMNGKAPPPDDEVITALQTYFFWLATGAPVGTPMDGAGYPELKPPAEAADRKRGELVYIENCAFCHGDNGQGQRSATSQVFPPLWGPRSFNWGAGMHRISTAAGFIHANMPLGKGGSLTEQQAWDVALFMNGHERPQDPRFAESVESTRKQFHEKDDSLYGQKIDGKVLGAAR